MTRAPSDRAPVTQADRERAGLFLSPSDGDFEELAALFRDHRTAALEAAAKVADSWRQADFDESANLMAENIRDEILSLKGQSDDQ